MTNTSMIGSINAAEPIDRLGAYYGYKAINLKVRDENGDYLFVSPHFRNHIYSTSASLGCHGKQDKPCENFERHTCGFYCYNTIEMAEHHWSFNASGYAHTALVKVALSGQVVVAEKGFRASHQRITDILLPKCWNNCESAGDSLVPHENGFLVSACKDCLDKIGFTAGLSHAEYSKLVSLDGYTPVNVLSSNKILDDALDFFEPNRYYESALQAVDKIQLKGDLIAMQKLSDELSRRMSSMLEAGIQT